MEAFAQLVYHLATAMLAPVLAALVIIFGWSLYSLGAFMAEWRNRRLDADIWSRMVADLSSERSTEHTLSLEGLRGEFVDAVRRGTPPEKTLADLEVSASGRLAWMSFGVRTGPLLGLMGTLIPMGPALVGLSSGDIEAMASNLVVVFSTTVVGVFVGGLCYAMLLARRHWCAQDLADFEYALGRPPAPAADGVVFDQDEERRRA